MGAEKKAGDKRREEYAEGLKKTLTPVLFGVLAGLLCFTIFVSTPYVVVLNGGVQEELDRGIVPDTVRTSFASKGTPLGEHVSVTEESTDRWRLNEARSLFFMDLELEGDLTNHTLSEPVRAAFKTHEIVLSDNVTIATENDGQWRITDEKARHTYHVQRVGDKLEVSEEIGAYLIRSEAEEVRFYAMPRSSDWLLIAILMVLVQKFVYPFMHTSIRGAKDWIYIAAITGLCWFITYALLLNTLF